MRLRRESCKLSELREDSFVSFGDSAVLFFVRFALRIRIWAQEMISLVRTAGSSC